MTKQEFIEFYITKMENTLNEYQNNNINEHDLFDCILEIKGVFMKEIPEIEDAIRIFDGSGKRDANIVIGILRQHLLCDKEKMNSESDNIEHAFRELRIEYDGIKDTIEEYTDDGNITNYLNKLGEAISSGDIAVIKYCLDGISNWYNKNILDIHSNQYVFNVGSHDENYEKIIRFNKIFKHVDNDCLIEERKQINSNEPIIFLSHKSDDKKYADALEKFIVGLGVKNHQLIYTSHPLHKIPLDSNIYDYLANRINSNTFMIFLWSDKYLESPACMNEMGAAWVVQSDYTNIYVPDFSFGNPKYRECAVDTSKMGAVLNGDEHCKASMLELKDKIQSIFKLEIDERTSQYLIDNFIKDIKEED